MRYGRLILRSAVVAALAVGTNAEDQETSTERASALAVEQRFGDAWSVVDAEPDPIEQSRGRTAVKYAAGDLGGALREAEAGLSQDAAQLDLLFYAASVSLTLGDRGRTDRYVSRFCEAVGARAAPENRSAWEAWCAEFERRAERLNAGAESKATAISRARVCIVVTLLLAIVALLGFGRSTS